MVLAACAGDDSGDAALFAADNAEPTNGGGDMSSGSPGTTIAAAAEETRDGDGTIGVNVEVADDRKVIRQAMLELQADDTREAFDRIVALAEAAVASSPTPLSTRFRVRTTNHLSS
jgi:hypothetical protein